MDFNDSKDEAAFRAEAAAWLKDNVPSRDEIAGLDELAAAKLWQKRKYDAGWACIRWDKEFALSVSVYPWSAKQRVRAEGAPARAT